MSFSSVDLQAQNLAAPNREIHAAQGPEVAVLSPCRAAGGAQRVDEGLLERPAGLQSPAKAHRHALGADHFVSHDGLRYI